MLCSYLTENATVGYRGQLISLTVDGVPSVLKKNAGVKLEYDRADSLTVNYTNSERGKYY